MSVKHQAVSGVMWNAIERFSTQGIQFVLTIVIARILSPDDYGLVAMLGIFMAIAQTFIDSGFSNALIQKQNRTEADCCTMFYFNIVVSVSIYILLFFSAPLIARFYNQPELVRITRIVGISLITNSLGSIQVARFTIELDFKKLAFASFASVGVSGSLGVWMACHGWGVWTLVFQSLLGSITWVATLWLEAKWFPKKAFSWDSFHGLFSFGSKILFSGLLHTLYTNLYSLVVGRCFNASTLGYFNRAFTLGQFPAQNFGNIVQKVLYPIQCRYQNDNERFDQILIYYLRISAFVLFPLMIGFAVLATPVVTLLLSEKWLPMVPLLRIMCISMMWLPIMQVNVQVLDAKGRSDYRLKAEIIKKILAICILFSALPWGIEALCMGMLAYSLVDMAVCISYSRRVTSVGYKAQIKILLPSLGLAACMGGVVWWAVCGIDSLSGQLVVGMVAGGCFYAVSACLLGFPEMKMIYSFLKNVAYG